MPDEHNAARTKPGSRLRELGLVLPKPPVLSKQDQKLSVQQKKPLNLENLCIPITPTPLPRPKPR
jgi:hypothetical protein